MDDGTSGEVQTIAVISTTPLRRRPGDFNESGTFYEKIVSWNGTVWSTLMHVTGPVIDIAVRGSVSVFVGGDFVHMVPDIEDGSAIEVNRFIYSDNSGGSWNAIGAGEDDRFERSGAAVNGAEVFGIKIGSDKEWLQCQVTSTRLRASVGRRVLGMDRPGRHLAAASISASTTRKFTPLSTEAGWFLGGQFVSVGDLKVRSIAQWTGETWAALRRLGYLPG
ncbi:MAG: hypothetical protein R2832_15035 [Rhodothermales bacterium]